MTTEFWMIFCDDCGRSIAKASEIDAYNALEVHRQIGHKARVKKIELED